MIANLLVLTAKRLVIVLTADDEQIYALDQTLMLGLLPGFALPVRDVFKDPFETSGAE